MAAYLLLRRYAGLNVWKNFNYLSPTYIQGEVQGDLFLKMPLPGIGRKANDSYDEFNQNYLTHLQGTL